MDMKDSRVIAAPIETVWAALNNPEILRQCIIGCDTLEPTENNGFVAAMSVKVGPVSAKFKGKLQLENVVAPKSYSLKFEGQGGPAGFANGSADVALSTVANGTQLDYSAKAMIGGKLAQVGARLVDAAARKIADDFFSKFDSIVAQPSLTSKESEPALAAADDETTTSPATLSGIKRIPVWLYVTVGALLAAALLKWCL
jgi:uncharacterized protein